MGWLLLIITVSWISLGLVVNRRRKSKDQQEPYQECPYE